MQIYSTLDNQLLGMNCPTAGENGQTAKAIETALTYAKLSASPKECFATKTKFDAEMKKPPCCYKAVVGELDQNTNKYKTNQKCSVDSDCYSGVCGESSDTSGGSGSSNGGSSSSGSSSGGSSSSGSSNANSCFTSDEQSGKNKQCMSASADRLSAAMAIFSTDFLAVKDIFGGSQTHRQLVKLFLRESSYSTCFLQVRSITFAKYGTTQATSAHRFFAKQCVYRKNHVTGSLTYTKVLVHKTTAECYDLTTEFCAVEQPWGGWEDITTKSSCSLVLRTRIAAKTGMMPTASQLMPI